VLRVRLEIDASRSATSLTGARCVQLIDPRSHAIDGFGGKLGANGHLLSTIARATKLGDQVRACSVARNDAHFPAAKGSLTAEELELEGVGFQI
jgi:hypothetical protein